MGALASRRGRRAASDDELLNLVELGGDDAVLVKLLAASEAQQCTQLLFCHTAAAENEVVLGKVKLIN